MVIKTEKIGKLSVWTQQDTHGKITKTVYFANLFLTLGFIDPEVFFIEGHFLPYYGLQVLAKGYHTVRRLAMKGNEIYVVSDLKGRPLFFITSSWIRPQGIRKATTGG